MALAGTYYADLYTVNCLPRLYKETFRDEAHVRHETDMEAAGALVGWGLDPPEHLIKEVVDTCVEAWEVIHRPAPA